MKGGKHLIPGSQNTVEDDAIGGKGLFSSLNEKERDHQESLPRTTDYGRWKYRHYSAKCDSIQAIRNH